MISSDTGPQWLKFQGCLLTESDRVVVISNDLLNDRHMNYAQTLLHHQFPTVKGLQDTLLQTKQQQKKSVVASR